MFYLLPRPWGVPLYLGFRLRNKPLEDLLPTPRCPRRHRAGRLFPAFAGALAASLAGLVLATGLAPDALAQKAKASPADTAIVAVGPRLVGPAEFRRQWTVSASRVVPAQATRDSQKVAFRDALVDRELLTLAAQDAGFEPSSQQEILLGAVRLIETRVVYYRRLISPGPAGGDDTPEGERARYEALVSKLLAPVAPAYVDSNLAVLVAAFTDVPPPISQGPSGPRFDFRLHLPEIPPADSGRALATTKSGIFSVQRFLSHWAQLGPLDRVPPGAVAEARLWTERFLAQGPMDEDARARGFDRLPEVEREVERRREALAAEWYFAREIVARIDTSEQKIRARWEADPKRYYGTDHYSYVQVWYPTREGAQNGMWLLRDGADWAGLLASRFPPGTPRDEIQAYRVVRELPVGASDTTLTKWFQAAAKNQAFGPREIDGRFWIYRFLGFQKGRESTYEEARQFVRDDWMLEESERVLRAHVAELRSRYPVRVSAQALAGVTVEDPFAETQRPPAPPQGGPLMPSIWETPGSNR